MNYFFVFPNFSPIFTPEEWSANGDTYAGGMCSNALNSFPRLHIRTLCICEAILICLSSSIHRVSRSYYVVIFDGA